MASAWLAITAVPMVDRASSARNDMDGYVEGTAAVMEESSGPPHSPPAEPDDCSRRPEKAVEDVRNDSHAGIPF